MDSDWYDLVSALIEIIFANVKVFKFRHVVNNDTFMHAVHTYTFANGSRKRFTAYCDTSHHFITMKECVK